MKANKKLYILGIILLFGFLGAQQLISYFSDKPQYTIMVYNYPLSFDELRQELDKELKDPNNRIDGFGTGVLDSPDKRFNVSDTPLYVLIKMKDRDIIFVTDKLEKLNDYIANHLK